AAGGGVAAGRRAAPLGPRGTDGAPRPRPAAARGGGPDGPVPGGGRTRIKTGFEEHRSAGVPPASRAARMAALPQPPLTTPDWPPGRRGFAAPSPARG